MTSNDWDPWDRTHFTLTEATSAIADEPPISQSLSDILSKMKLPPETLDKLTISIDCDTEQQTIQKVYAELEKLQKDIEHSKLMGFQLSALEVKYPAAISLVRDRQAAMGNKMGPSSLVGDSITDAERDDFLKGINLRESRGLTIGQIMDFRSSLNVKTRRASNHDVASKFDREVAKRHLVGTIFPPSESDMSDSSGKATEAASVVTERSSIISRDSLLVIVNDLVTLYGSIQHRSQWKSHIDHIKNTIKTSFERYCKASKQYEFVLAIKNDIQAWLDQFNGIMKLVNDNGKTTELVEENDSPNREVEENDSPNREVDSKKNKDTKSDTTLPQSTVDDLEELLLIKNKKDQEFLANFVKSVRFDEIREEMKTTSEIFMSHYRMVTDIVQPLAKHNCCRICLNNAADRFISTCGHVMCGTCADTIIKDDSGMSRRRLLSFDDITQPKSSVCPFCKQVFTETDIKKIFY